MAAVVAGAVLFGNPTTSRWTLGGLIGGVEGLPSITAHGLQRARWLRNKSLQNRRRRKRRDEKSRSVPSGEAVSVVAVESEAMNYLDIDIDFS
uniref:hypothetical protein n=1 Tax=Synechococcus sp. UW106 TaxID=368495 RepID=UPI001A7E1B70|nr:hypothetical protein [Synechococcus sp. UW106]